MSVIAEISVPADDFELGRILELSAAGMVELESLVPTGERVVPYFWVCDADFEAFEAATESHPAVERLTRIDVFDDRVLYSLSWSAGNDRMFQSVDHVDAYILAATGSADSWEFELRFPDHDAMSAFQNRCGDRGVSFEVLRVFNPSKPDIGPWFGLTEPQREALVLAVEQGYYDIPRNCKTVEIADELGISDQAVTERLRRAIATLSSNTVLSSSDR
jgi:predicted DNA binding protein